MDMFGFPRCVSQSSPGRITVAPAAVDTLLSVELLTVLHAIQRLFCKTRQKPAFLDNPTNCNLLQGVGGDGFGFTDLTPISAMCN